MFIKTVIVILIFVAAILVSQVRTNAHWSHNLALAAVSLGMLSIVLVVLL